MNKQLPDWANEMVRVGSSRWESEYAAAIDATGMYRHDRANFAGALIEEIERLRAELSAESGVQACGHGTKWLAYRDGTDPASERYCVFCEVERLRANLAASTELLASARRITFGYHLGDTRMVYYLDGKYAGPSLDDVIEKAAEAAGD